jgi:hypothetical protein
MFSLRFVAPEEIQPGHVDDDWDGEEDLMNVAIAAGQLLDAAGATFHAGGFGDEHWPVEVYPELSIVIEQLPGVLRALRAGEASKIDFYEQGIERSVEIVPNGDVVDLRCRCWMDWVPNPDSETMSRSDLLAMFETLSRAVAEAVTAIDPLLGSCRPLSDWSDGGPVG